MRCSNKVRPIPSFTASHHQNESSCKFLKISTGEYKYNINFVHNNDFAITLFPRKGVGISREWSRIPKKSFWKSGINFFCMKTNQIFKNIRGVTSHKFTSFKAKQKTKKGKRKKTTLAGNRTRASRVAGENSTTEPPVLCMVKRLINWILNMWTFTQSDQTDKTNHDFDLRWQLIVRISTSINKIQVSLHDDNLYDHPRWFTF